MDEDKVLVPCQCGCGIWSVMEFEPNWDEPQNFIFEFYMGYRPKQARKARWKIAWKMFRGKDPWLHDVVLYREQAEALRLFLNSKLG